MTKCVTMGDALISMCNEVTQADPGTCKTLTDLETDKKRCECVSDLRGETQRYTRHRTMIIMKNKDQ